MKIISIGTNHAGTSFVRTLATLSNEHEIVTYDRNTDISFLGCGIALWVGGEFDSPDGLFYATPEKLRSMGIKVKMEHEVIEVNSEEKYVVVKDLKTGEEFKDSYDKLVFAGGTWPVEIPFPGVESNNIFLSKIYSHAQAIKAKADDKSVKDVVVVGAGYIGTELVEAFHKKGKNVVLIDMVDRVIPSYFDKEFTTKMEKQMIKDGIQLQLGEKVQEFKSNSSGDVTAVVTDKGEYPADMVIMSIGFKPNTKLLEGQVDMVANGGIKVDNTMLSSNKDIYAIGDSSAVYHNVFKEHVNIALATNAVKTGVVAAMAINNPSAPLEFPGSQGTNAINVFGCHYASTGISEETAKIAEIEHAVSVWKDMDRPEFMHNAEEVQLKIVYDPKTLKLLGAQVGSWGTHTHTEVIYALSLAISQGVTLPELALMDVYFLPHYNKPFNFILQPILNSLGIVYK